LKKGLPAMRYSTWSLMVLFCSLLVFAPPAGAVDGVVLIHQGTSVNGLPGCPHAGFPILICHSGSYRLAANLDVAAVNTDAIDITTDNVTLDLNGFTISGPSVCTGPPVQCTNVGTSKGILSQFRGTTVRNGTVRGFGTGLILGSMAVADSVRAESNSDVNFGGILVGDGLVIHCTANLNAGSGILGGSVVSFNSATANGAFGIFGGATVSNNTVSFNGLDGIHDAFTMLFNTSWSNVGAGITTGFVDAGYMGNVVLSNQGGTISGGHSLGHNLCDGVAC
jgi:hypothetical protein